MTISKWTVPAAAAVLALTACAEHISPDKQPATELECSIPTDDIFSGGVSRDGIPALTNPEITPASVATRIAETDRILGVVVNGEARAYPFGILWWHEIVNDTLGGEPILVTYCPLTGSGIAFDPVIDSEARNFGVSGLLYENNLIMFDRKTESLWNQMLLGSQCGPDRGQGLRRIPLVETTWRQWKSMYPNTTVLSFNTGFPDRSYGVYPYGDYAEPNNSFRILPGSRFSLARPPKEPVLGVFSGTSALAFPYGKLRGEGAAAAINETVGTRPVVAFWMDADQTAVAYDPVVSGQQLTFRVEDSVLQRFADNETGSIWNANGEAISGQLAGQQLARIDDAFVAFWFAWSVYYPETRIYD